jgi:hypothetical protein
MQWVNHSLTAAATPGATPGKPAGQPSGPSHGGSHGGIFGPGGAIRPGFNSTILDRNDDGSSPPVQMGFTVSFECETPTDTVYVNNNGNITFNFPLSTYTPPPLNSLGDDIIAPFFADVDTRDPGSGIMAYGQGTVDGHPAFGATWPNVGYYNQHSSPTNSFQAILISRPDISPLDFDIEFNYSHINWETGDASGGIGGLGGNSARVGYSTADGSHSLELPGSAVNGAFLDGGPNSLVAGSIGSNVAGRYVFQVRNEDCVDVHQIQFNGAGNVPIRIDETTRIGSPGNPNGPDVQWVRGQRDGANTTAAWDTTQSAPAAFIRNNPLHATVTFDVMAANVTSMVISASSTGPYGNIPNTTVNVTGGTGTADVTSSQSRTFVDFNDITFQWHLESVTVGGQTMNTHSALIHTTTHRIYTLYANPDQAGYEPARVPWATVLELATSLTFTDNTDTSVVQDLTRGLHYSRWRPYNTLLHFVNAQAVLTYEPDSVRTQPTGPVGNIFISQRYDLTSFMNAMPGPLNVQQCNDNANLLSIFARSLGVNVTPLWLANNPFRDGGGNVVFMRQTQYFPAGRDTQTDPIRFSFHQIGLYNNMVYDPSTRPAVTGDPNMSVPLAMYMQNVFGYTDPAQYTTRNVTTLTIGNVPRRHFRADAVAPNHSSVGTTTNITVTGAGFNMATRVWAYEADLSGPAAGVTVQNVTRVNSGTITFNLVVAGGATPRNIRIVVLRTVDEVAGIRPYTIDP